MHFDLITLALKWWLHVTLYVCAQHVCCIIWVTWKNYNVWSKWNSGLISLVELTSCSHFTYPWQNFSTFTGSYFCCDHETQQLMVAIKSCTAFCSAPMNGACISSSSCHGSQDCTEDSDETGCLAAVLLVPPVAAALIVCCYKVYSDINYHYQLGSYICSHELGIPYLLSS